MTLEVDHAFIGCITGAPEADVLLQLGLVEGSANIHPGQGTANRRFFFDNFMLELLWVAETTGARVRRTRLSERCANREGRTCPFGIIFRATGDDGSAAPFPTWPYYASYLPQGLAIEIAEGTTLEEPELFYLPFARRAGNRGSTCAPHCLWFSLLSLSFTDH